MKRSFLFISILIPFILQMGSCSYDSPSPNNTVVNVIDTLKVTHAEKGWELYSWTDNGVWHYSILAGTNRVKTLEEIQSPAPSATLLIQVDDLNQLKKVLAKFPENEVITWIGEGWLNNSWQTGYGNLRLPDDKVVNEIRLLCNQLGLTLQVTD